MRQYYLHNGYEQQGPFLLDELKGKKLSKTTPVWYEGLEDWATLEDVLELQHVVSATPPPLEKKSFVAPEFMAEKANKTMPVEVKKAKSKSSKRFLVTTLIVVVLGLSAVLLLNLIKTQQHESAQKAAAYLKEVDKELIRRDITSYVQPEVVDYSTGWLGGIKNLEVAVTNSTDYTVENVKVKVVYIKENGEVWDARVVDFNILEPHTKSTLRLPNTTRGKSVRTELVSIRSNDLGLN